MIPSVRNEEIRLSSSTLKAVYLVRYLVLINNSSPHQHLPRDAEILALVSRGHSLADIGMRALVCDGNNVPSIVKVSMRKAVVRRSRL